MSKILFISPNPVWGGAATANVSIAKMLSDSGYKTLYNDEFYEKDYYDGLQIFHYNIHGKQKDSNKNLLRLVKELNVGTIIWGNTLVFYKYIPAIIKLNKRNINQISIYHSLSLNSSIVGKFFEMVSNILARYMNHIVYVSQFTQVSWEKYSGFKKAHNRSIVIHNPLEYNGSSHVVENFNEFKIGFVGRFSNENQPEIFCKSSDVSGFKYIAYGDGPLLENMRAKYPRVNFEGNCSNPDIIYQNIDILVMTSAFENCPMVILESKARGIPCVVPNVGGISEIVSNNVDGILFDNYNQSEILSAINIIKDNYSSFQKSCLRRADSYRPQNLVKKWKSII